ncbi:MAG TPA: Gfo/Idh/MocA family oxidoreductase [Opitutaceae bacterium]|jgi:predicted dehydrogenase
MPQHAHLEGRSLVRWGIIGCGDVTEVKSGPGFQKAGRSKLVAVMRRNGALAQDYAKRHGVPRSYADGAALIADPEVDAVYIATPPDTHCSYALAVAAAGKPAYVEKPMARHAPECDRMVDAFKSADLPLFVAYYRRRLPCFLKVEELLKGGAIGNLTGVTYRMAEPHHRRAKMWRTDVAVAGAGHFLDVGSHALDLLDYLLGPLENVAGNAANLASDYEAEDSVAMTFMAGGAPGAASWNFASDTREELMRLSGTDGEISFPMFTSSPVRLVRGAKEETFDLPYPPHVAQPLIQTIVDDLLGTGLCPSTGETGRRTTRVMDRVLDEYYGGRGDEFWLRSPRARRGAS